jgi:hypothetical protein
MPYQPSLSQVHLDAALTNFSIAYMQDATGFVADQVFPVVPVDHKSDKYHIFAKDAFLRAGGRQTPFGQEAPRGGFSMSNDSYDVGTPWRWAFDLTPDIAANADAGVNVDKSASDYVMNALMIQREVQWGNNFFKTGVWSVDKVGATDFAQWDDDADSDPITDISKARSAIKKTTPYLPNTMVVGFNVHETLIKHPLILDRFKYTSSDSISEAMLARIFQVDRYMVTSAVQVTTQEGETLATDFILGSHVLLCYAAPSPGLMAHSAGYTFVWSKLTGLNNLGVATFRTPMPWLGQTQNAVTERIEANYAYQHKATGTDLGYFFSNAVSY